MTDWWLTATVYIHDLANDFQTKNQATAGNLGDSADASSSRGGSLCIVVYVTVALQEQGDIAKTQL